MANHARQRQGIHHEEGSAEELAGAEEAKADVEEKKAGAEAGPAKEASEGESPRKRRGKK